jgi:ATP-binding cassette subfamily A (ABC1) protein 3
MRYEGTQEGIHWENVFNPIDADDDFNLGYVWIMLIIDSLIYLGIALYVERIFPGDYGVAEKWNFLFTKSFWVKNLNHIDLAESNLNEYGDCIEMSDSSDFDSGNFESHSSLKKVGIKIVNLRKIYGDDKVAVDGLNLNLCENEITVLLGHNGAGKSTTMSILTGMIRPTSGTAIIEGRDIRTDMSLIRSSIGFCPQHDILFDNLTVRDHITFYALLKGMRNDQAENEVMKYVKLLKLEPKIDTKSKDLSGGMKRKLSVAIALCGNSKIIFFDEPSSGVDPGARRDLLELIQKEKKGRTILLSTHFMQDAEVLGDRVSNLV